MCFTSRVEYFILKPMHEINLTIDSLTCIYRKQKILNEINLSLNNPQAVTLLGPNGAGKSTLLKSLAAVLYCQSGTVSINALDSEKDRLKYLLHVGYMPESAAIMPELSVLEQLQFTASINQVSNTEEDIERVVEICQLKQVIMKRTNQLSLGYKQRLNLAQAIIHKPQVLIMDEPLNGLDPHLIIEFREIIKQMKKECLIIMSTHYLAEAANISDRVLIMQHGKLLDNIDPSTFENFDLEKLYLEHTKEVGAV